MLLLVAATAAGAFSLFVVGLATYVSDPFQSLVGGVDYRQPPPSEWARLPICESALVACLKECRPYYSPFCDRACTLHSILPPRGLGQKRAVRNFIAVEAALSPPD